MTATIQFDKRMWAVGIYWDVLIMLGTEPWRKKLVVYIWPLPGVQIKITADRGPYYRPK